MKKLLNTALGLGFALGFVFAAPVFSPGSVSAEETNDQVKYILVNQEPGYKCEECCPSPVWMCCTLPVEGACS